MKRAIIKPVIIILTIITWSCLNERNKDKEVNYIIDYKIVPSISANPAAHRFRLHIGSELLREVLVNEKWGYISISGGHFGKASYYYPHTLGIAETDIQNVLTMGLPKGGFSQYTQDEKDSIASLTLKEAEINIYCIEAHWKLKPLEKETEK